MASFNYSTMQMTSKIVYYGPGLGGKTTNLKYIYDKTTPQSRGEMVSLETQADRTLFFDLLPLEVGTIAGFRTRIQLYTVPGQVFYNTTRKLVLKGVDGLVFVADSQRSMLDANVESLRNLEANLAELGILLDTIPVYLQFNKRDLPDVFSVTELNDILNPRDWPYQEASAISGAGVFETLRSISKLTLISLKKQLEAPRGRGSLAAGRPAAKAPLDTATTPAAPQAPPAASPPAGLQEAPEFSPAGGNGRYELKRNLLLNLKRPDLQRASAVSLDLQVEDAHQQVVHRVRNLRLSLAPRQGEEGEEVLLQLQIALNPED